MYIYINKIIIFIFFKYASDFCLHRVCFFSSNLTILIFRKAATLRGPDIWHTVVSWFIFLILLFLFDFLLQVWSLSTHSLIHTFVNEHARQSIFRNIGTGVMQIEAGLANHIFSCGADGTMKMRILPDRFSTMNGVWKNDVKCII